jgi:hypothetical protein
LSAWNAGNRYTQKLHTQKHIRNTDHSVHNIYIYTHTYIFLVHIQSHSVKSGDPSCLNLSFRRHRRPDRPSRSEREEMHRGPRVLRGARVPTPPMDPEDPLGLL